ncbi:tRNA glutamyl-Q(34) synthetase GluQRS [Thiohalorhabdus methylotrophus]|uniref:Glutamyl-Q tRNA(Asp) synthetase n=1 Tax=Thiohalorhabdus methylotrophus TaxID=3242694 RepID=A0ABV4TXX1_9GAMM
MHTPYTGRFAPSPTGALHFGSLVAALASYLEARAHGGYWLVRMEDLDPPRVEPGAADGILRTLEAYGLRWDGPVLYQSTRTEAYQATLETLRREGLAYDCGCTRKEIRAAVEARGLGAVYPGTCRGGLPPGKAPRAVRLRVADREITFDDTVQGRFVQDLAAEVGDFVVRRADGLFAYQLAVVADDAEQGVTHVVRGADLLGSTPRQIFLQDCLGVATPEYAHVPLAATPQGHKLSKQTRARALPEADPVPQLVAAFAFLGQPLPADGERMTTEAFWDWARAVWDPDRIAPQERVAFSGS